ncbi:MAG: hypothetical protein GEU92_21560, partial [Alphaproteobacteria bacterium]|nr:hypothetical protein [Alphaproteobacteria bacterium]
MSPSDGASGSEARGERSGQPLRLASLVNGWWLGALVAAYAVAFWAGVSDLSGEAANYPRTVIVALLAFVVWGFAADTMAWR